MTSSPAQRLQLAREYLAERAARNPNVTPSRTFVNSTTTGPLVAPVMRSARDDADQHQQFHSAGYRPQIDRRTA